MATGDPTATNHGTFNISGTALKVAIDGLTDYHPLLSGSSLHLVPTGSGQCGLIVVRVEGTG